MMKATVKEKKAKRISFILEAPDAGWVSLAGDFNAWNPGDLLLKRDKKGIWKTSVNLFPGVYQYRFLVDGDWRNDPNAAECAENPFGTLNCVKRVG
jgi:1,4-alpha-glucan branching enzyme